MENYPEFKRGETQTIYSKLKRTDKSMLEEYLKYRSIGTKSKNKLEDFKRFITQFLFIIEKDIGKLQLKDIRNFLSLLNATERTTAGKDDLVACLKNFLKWKFKNWSLRFSELKDLKIHSRNKKFNHKKINSAVLLTKEDVEKIANTENNIFWKTFFMTLYESGVRPIEIRTLKWKNVNFEDGLAELSIYATKTGMARTVYVKQASTLLTSWKEHQTPESEYVFPSFNDPLIPIPKSTVGSWLDILTQKAIGRKIFPYIIRHSRATELYTLAKQNKISKDVAQMFMGHGEDMSEIYTHLNKDQIKEMMTKTVYQISEIPEEKKHRLEEEIKKLQKDFDNKEIENAQRFAEFRDKEKEYSKMFIYLKEELGRLKEAKKDKAISLKLS